MFCPRCGTNVPEGGMFCQTCGTRVADNSAEQPNVNFYNQGYPTQPVGSVPCQTPYQPPMPMKWFKFLIYFGLFAGALLNIINGYSYLTGNFYGSSGEAEMVYAFFTDLKLVDTITGILLLFAGIFQIYTRFRLAGYKKNAPTLLTWCYALGIISSLIYIIGVYVALGAYAEEIISSAIPSLVGSFIGSGLAIVINLSYFKKRAHLFTR